MKKGIFQGVWCGDGSPLSHTVTRPDQRVMGRNKNESGKGRNERNCNTSKKNILFFPFAEKMYLLLSSICKNHGQDNKLHELVYNNMTKDLFLFETINLTAKINMELRVMLEDVKHLNSVARSEFKTNVTA